MIFHVKMEVHIPSEWNAEKVADYLKRERETSQKYQKSGQWVYLWRVAGQYANISILDVESPDELHRIISELPLFPYMKIEVTPLCKHPNSVKETLI